jgi:hypothetical protein
MIASAANPDYRKIKLVLERMETGGWRSIDPGLVLERGDRVRFRFETNFAGYLYVINYASSGKYSTLYPLSSAGSQNKIASGEVRQVPAGDLDFRITGPAGQETVYWIVSPVELPGYGAAAAGKPSSPPAQMVPRCDDAILKARGDCVDSTAGARDLDPDDHVAGPLKLNEKPPPLTFLRESNSSVVAATGAPGAPIIYEFRISHN